MIRSLSRCLPALALVVTVAACGDDGDSDEGAATTVPATDPAPTAPAPTDAATRAFPVTVEHALGATVIETEPVRVVTVGVTEQDTVLALGVQPVGVTDWYGDQPYATWPWAQDELGDAQPEVLTTADGLDYERITALEPDLIIGTNAGLDEESYGLLSAIAPTIAHPQDAPLYFSPWDDQARLIGQALGRADEMEAIIADIDAQFAAAASAHPEFAGVQVAFLQNAFYDGNAIAYQDGLSTDFLTDLGFAIPAVLDDFQSDGGQAYIPLEQLSVLDDADVLLWATESPDDRAALETEPLYMGLEAVQDGTLVFTDGITAGAIYFTSPLSLPFVLEQLVPAMASTIAGEGPATIESA
ncbi:MAG TPA: iron-siderophore ABC transporter substrate-binding protein [Ilumatobacteraceae bacterium]|nr:iron-siderophore ABC transporter substrate-binding protein [Ilumatobacteraceae bacterium]